MSGQTAKRVDALVDAVVAAHPDRTAFMIGARTWTYVAVGAEMHRRAAMLVETGLNVGDVLVTNETAPDEIAVTFFACCRAGVALLHLWPQMPPSESVSLAARARARRVLTAHGDPHPAFPMLPPLALLLPGEPGAAASDEAAAREIAMTADAAAIVQPTSGTTGLPKLILLPHRQLTWLTRASL